MAKAKVKSEIVCDVKITIELTLAEAKALKEITGYGADSFLEGYYKQLGKSYLKPHEKGVRSLFETIQESLPSEIKKADDTLKLINEAITLTTK